MSRLLIASAIVLSSVPFLSTASADSNLGTPTDDTRFGEIGKASEDPTAEKRPITTGLGTSRVGRVMYSGLRVDVPMSNKWSVIPQAALLYISPYRVGDQSVLLPYIGGGVGYRPAPSWSLELSGMYGPSAHDIESVTGNFGVSKEFGGDWSQDIAPPVTLELTLNTARFLWESGNGPAGQTIWQGWASGQALLRATSRFQIIPRGSYFIYDKSLHDAVGVRLGSISVLAQVGSYAPRGVVGGRIGYWLGSERVFPFIDGQQIWYAANVGTATQIAGGLRVNLGKSAHVMAMGGLLHNSVSGPLISPDYDLRNVPVIAGEVEVAF